MALHFLFSLLCNEPHLWAQSHPRRLEHFSGHATRRAPHGEEHRPLHREAAVPVLKQFRQDLRQSQLFPQPPEDQGRAETGAGEDLGVAGAVLG